MDRQMAYGTVVQRGLGAAASWRIASEGVTFIPLLATGLFALFITCMALLAA